MTTIAEIAAHPATFGPLVLFAGVIGAGLIASLLAR